MVNAINAACESMYHESPVTINGHTGIVANVDFTDSGVNIWFTTGYVVTL